MDQLDESTVTSLENIIDEGQELLDQILQTRVTVVNNTIEIYTLFENMKIALMKTGNNNDPNFVNIVKNMKTDKLIDTTMASLSQEFNELLDKFVNSI